jgi:hypothetical protein
MQTEDRARFAACMYAIFQSYGGRSPAADTLTAYWEDLRGAFSTVEEFSAAADRARLESAQWPPSSAAIRLQGRPLNPLRSVESSENRRRREETEKYLEPLRQRRAFEALEAPDEKKLLH